MLFGVPDEIMDMTRNSRMGRRGEPSLVAIFIIPALSMTRRE